MSSTKHGDTLTGGGETSPVWLIDVDRRNLMENVKDGGARPVIKIWENGEVIERCNAVRIPDGSTLVYSETPIVPDGARCAIRCKARPRCF